jgi:predicted MPP superfamily phosphohydrolase
MAYTRSHYNRIVSVLYTVSVVWFPTILYLFFGSIVVSIVAVAEIYLNYPIDLAILSWTIIGIIVVSISYGLINAECMRITEYTIDSPELSKKWAGKKVILFSDVHLGAVRRERFARKLTRIVNTLKPDMTIIAGDIIDGPVFDYVKGLTPFKDIVTPGGLIYAQGNHEGYNSEPEVFYPIVESLTTALIDRTIMIDGVHLIGLAYAHESIDETKKRLHSTGYNPEIPSVVILHDPTNTKALQDEGVSLVLSGHTHSGQFFPFTLFMKRMYHQFRYGKNVKGKTTSITTSGVGTTGPSLRLGSNPEIVVLTFK